MATIKEQLEAAGYDTSHMDESQILDGLDKAGYDVSAYKQAPSAMDIAKDQLAKPVLQQLGELKDAAKTGGAAAEQTIAEGLAEKGVHPAIAALAGRAFNTLLNIPTAAAEGMATVVSPTGGAEMAAESALGKAVRFTGQKEADKIGLDLAKNSAEEAALNASRTQLKSSLAERLAKEQALADTTKQGMLDTLNQQKARGLDELRQLPIDRSAKEAALNAAKSQYGKDIGMAEKELGVGLDNPNISAFVRKNAGSNKAIGKFAAKYASLASRDVEELGQLSPETLQGVKKSAEQAYKRVASGATVDDLTKSQLLSIKSKFRDALALQNNKLGEAVSKYRDASQALEALPDEFSQKANVLRAGLQRITNATNTVKSTTLNQEKLDALNRAISIVERNAKEVPAQYAAQRAKLNLALEAAQNLAKDQTRLRRLAGGVAVTGAAAYAGRQAARRLMGQ